MCDRVPIHLVSTVEEREKKIEFFSETNFLALFNQQQMKVLPFFSSWLSGIFQLKTIALVRV